LGGDDKAIVTGKVDDGIRVIIVGGKGKDELIDSSVVHGYFLGITPFPSTKTKTEFYDSGNKTLFTETSGTYINTAKYKVPKDKQKRYEPSVEDRYQDYGVLLPLEYNTDDGAVLGIGGRINYYDFRKDPYGHRFDLSGSYATRSNRAEFEFLGDFNDMFEGINVKIPIRYTGLEITKFFGFGNETANDDSLLEAGYYDVNQKYYGAGFNIKIPTESDIELRVGLQLEFSDILKQDERLLTTLNPYGTGELDFITLSGSIRFDDRDHTEMPSEGYYFCLYGDFYPKSISNEQNFGKAVFDGRTYLSDEFITPFTLALRTYGEMVWGAYPFYKGASIGGSNSLRGFYRERFVGDKAIMGSAELRYFLADVFILIPFKMGMNLFTDAGRVFYENEDSKKWHSSFGGGLWFSVYEKTLNLSVNIAKSPEDLRLYINLGQMF
jgi:outer membrane protein assembly factor BamA